MPYANLEKRLTYHREYHRKNYDPEKARIHWHTRGRELARIRRERNKEKTRLIDRRDNLKRAYGLTIDEFDKMVEVQKGLCAICGNQELQIRDGKVRPLSVDHDHKTGKIRGLLCNNCNRAIGLLGEDIKTLQAAADYLLKSQGVM